MRPGSAAENNRNCPQIVAGAPRGKCVPDRSPGDSARSGPVPLGLLCSLAIARAAARARRETQAMPRVPGNERYACPLPTLPPACREEKPYRLLEQGIWFLASTGRKWERSRTQQRAGGLFTTGTYGTSTDSRSPSLRNSSSHSRANSSPPSASARKRGCCDCKIRKNVFCAFQRRTSKGSLFTSDTA